MIDLTSLKLRASPPQLLDFGGTLTPSLGGPRQRINRLGTRWAFAFETPNMKMEPDGRIWSTRLARAKTDGALIWVPEPDYVHTGAATAVVAGGAASVGTKLYLVNAAANQLFPEGKWLSLIHDGRRYLHRVATSVAADASGFSPIDIFPMLRVIPTTGDVVEIAEPKMQSSSIEGDFGWPVEVGGFTSFSFTLAEDE